MEADQGSGKTREAEVSANGEQIQPSTLDRLVCDHMVSLGWFSRNGKWLHEIFPVGFSLQDVVDDLKWRKLSHWLRESFWHTLFFALSPSPRHELQGVDIHAYDFSRV